MNYLLKAKHMYRCYVTLPNVDTGARDAAECELGIQYTRYLMRQNGCPNEYRLGLDRPVKHGFLEYACANVENTQEHDPLYEYSSRPSTFIENACQAYRLDKENFVQ